MLLHSGDLLEGETQRIYHEYTLRGIDLIGLVEFNCDNEQNEQYHETIYETYEWVGVDTVP